GRPPLGTKCPLHALCWRGDVEQSGVQGFLSTPDCQGEGAKGRAHRLHAQADRHPEHHDRPWREVGSQTIPVGLTSAPISRSDRGRSPVYFNNPVAMRTTRCSIRSLAAFWTRKRPLGGTSRWTMRRERNSSPKR